MTATKRRGKTAADRRPEAPWGRVWIVAAIVTLVCLGGWELFWRSRGWVATATDPAAWTMARTSLEAESSVFLGSSRMQAGLDPKVWADETGGSPPIMLAVFGSTPTPGLDHLADTPEFVGDVVVDWLPGQTLDEREDTSGIDGMVEAWEMAGVSPGRWLETRLSYATNPRLVFRRPVLSVRSLLEIIWDRQWPRSMFLWPSRGMRRDRFYPMEFPERDRDAPVPPAPEGLSPRTWNESYEAMFQRVEEATRRIQARGGEVVFVRFPSCRMRGEIEEIVFPKAEFWDRFAARTSGRTIHFTDHASLSGFDCPDGSHLDVRDTPAFTRALAGLVTAP